MLRSEKRNDWIDEHDVTVMIAREKTSRLAYMFAYDSWNVLVIDDR